MELVHSKFTKLHATQMIQGIKLLPSSQKKPRKHITTRQSVSPKDRNSRHVEMPKQKGWLPVFHSTHVTKLPDAVENYLQELFTKPI